MPTRPKKPCAHPGCGALVDGGRCEKHRQNYDRQRGSAALRKYDYRWQKAREHYLARNPLCAECRRNGVVTAANTVDHIVPHRGDELLFWDETNWQSLCPHCHSSVKQRIERAAVTARSLPCKKFS